MARILILSLVFRPDNVSTAQIMGELAEDLKAQGHEILVLTTVPHYNDDPEAEKDQPLVPRWGGLLRESNYRGMRVLHFWMPRKGRNKWLRVVAWLGFHAASTLAGAASRFRPDLVLAPSPPLTIGVSAWVLGLRHQCPFIYNVQEIYPDVAVNLGVLRNPFAIRLLQGLERFVYAKARALTVISEGMAGRILAKGLARGKIRVIPNFVDLADFHPLPKVNGFSLRHGLQDRFVVSYAGNMGQPQGLDTLIEAADLLRAEPDLHFLLMGDGSERETLIERARRLQMPNLTILPYQPYSVMAEAYAAADASFVPQAAGTSSDGIPSKVYRIMACERPVIACTDARSDLAQLVERAEGGMVVPPGDSAALAAAIRKLLDQRESWPARCGRARRYILKHFSRPTVSACYHELITELTAQGG